MIFEVLIPNLIPLYILIAMGFAAGRYMDVNLHSLATLLIYFVGPLVIFGAVAQMPLRLEFLYLPVCLGAASLFVTLLSYKFAKVVFQRTNFPNLIAMASPTCNSGYFGLPVVIALFGAEASGLYLLGNVGAEIVMVTVGYYFGARGNFNARQSIIKVIRLPMIYGLLAGLAFNALGYELNETFISFWTYFTGTWVVIGMMLIGVALGKPERFTINWKLLNFLSAIKFILWPGIIFLAIIFDQNITQAFDPVIYGMFMVWGLCPLMANTVAYAAQLNVRPDEAAMCVLLTTFMALFLMPLGLHLTRLL